MYTNTDFLLICLGRTGKEAMEMSDNAALISPTFPEFSGMPSL